MEAMPSMRKNHCHECSPATPPIVVRMPAARKPDTMLEMVLPACQMAMRVGLSCLVYQEDVTVMERVSAHSPCPGGFGESAYLE